MLKTDPGLTTELPIWLIACTIILLTARISLFAYEHEHPPRPSDEIHWQEFTGEKAIVSTGKPVLYYFTARWSAAVKKLESNAFSNKEVVRFVNDNFEPIRVVDVSVEEHANEPQIQKLEDKYGLSALKVFPKLIVTLPDGSEVQRSIGARNSALIKKFLEETLKSEDYVRAKNEFKNENWGKAAEFFSEYLKKNGFKADRSTYSVLREYISLKLAGRNKQATELLNTDLENIDTTRWPYPVLAYLAHAIDEKELLKRAGDAQDKRTELHAYVGTEYYLDGDLAKAKEHLKQSTSDPHFREWAEFQLASSILKHIDEKPNKNGTTSR
jgi:thioredoxin-like negative regulator of GroEL